MTVLVTIGDFSRMTYLTVKALRHYHDIGLLEPVSVDPQNGYRLYGTDQVADAQTIRRFRELEMPTDEIREVLDASDDDRRNEVIVAHLDRMQDRLERTQSTVESLRSLLRGSGSAVAVSFRVLQPTPAIGIRERISFDDAEQWCAGAYAELHEVLVSSGADAGGPDGALYATTFFEDGDGDVTAFVPITGEVDDVGRVAVIEVPGFAAATATHRGSFETLDQTYGTLGTRVAELGTGADGPMREHYLDDDSIEVCWPIRRLP